MTADMADSSGREEQILVMSGHSSFPLSLSSILLHSEVSLLEMTDALSGITVPLEMIQCLRLPGIDATMTSAMPRAIKEKTLVTLEAYL